MPKTCADTMLMHIKAYAADYYDRAKKKPNESFADINLIIDALGSKKTEGKLTPLSLSFYNRIVESIQQCMSNDKYKLRSEILKLLTLIKLKLESLVKKQPSNTLEDENKEVKGKDE